MKLWSWKNKQNRKDGNQPEVKMAEKEGKMIKLKPNPTGPAANTITTKKMTIKSTIVCNEKFDFSIPMKYLPRVRYLWCMIWCATFCTRVGRE